MLPGRVTRRRGQALEYASFDAVVVELADLGYMPILRR